MSFVGKLSPAGEGHNNSSMNKPKAETKEMFKIITVVRLKALGVATRARLRESPVQSSIFFHPHVSSIFTELFILILLQQSLTLKSMHVWPYFFKKETQLVDG